MPPDVITGLSSNDSSDSDKSVGTALDDVKNNKVINGSKAAIKRTFVYNWLTKYMWLKYIDGKT